MTDDMADVFQRAFPNISPHYIQRIREMQRRVECERQRLKNLDAMLQRAQKPRFRVYAILGDT